MASVPLPPNPGSQLELFFHLSPSTDSLRSGGQRQKGKWKGDVLFQTKRVSAASSGHLWIRGRQMGHTAHHRGYGGESPRLLRGIPKGDAAGERGASRKHSKHVNAPVLFSPCAPFLTESEVFSPVGCESRGWCGWRGQSRVTLNTCLMRHHQLEMLIFKGFVCTNCMWIFSIYY